MLNVVEVTFAEGATTAISPAQYQYNYGQFLLIHGLPLPTSYEMHFANAQTGESTTQIGDASGVRIPDVYYQTGKPIYAWVFLHEGETDGETLYRVTIPIIQRAKPDDLTPEAESAIEQAIRAINEYSNDSEAWAVGTRNGEDVPQSDITFHNNSKYYADKAEQEANTAGYMEIWMDDEGHLQYTRTDLIDTDFEIDEDGHLILEVG